MVQYPDTNGEITDFTEIGNILHSNKALFAMATDLLALTVLKPPSEFGADIALGTSQDLVFHLVMVAHTLHFSLLHLNMRERFQEE